MKFFSLVLLCVGAVFSQNNIALVNFEALGGLDEGEAKMIRNRLEIELGKQGEFRVLERSQMETILTEQGFQNSGCTGSECMVEMGQLLGVQKVVNGHVGKIGSMYSLSAKLVNVESGEIERSVSEDVKGSLEQVFLEGCANLAAKLSGKVLATSPAPLESKESSQEEKAASLEDSSGGSWLWWILGGTAVAGGVSAFVLLSDPGVEYTEREVKIQ